MLGLLRIRGGAHGEDEGTIAGLQAALVEMQAEVTTVAELRADVAAPDGAVQELSSELDVSGRHNNLTMLSSDCWAARRSSSSDDSCCTAPSRAATSRKMRSKLLSLVCFALTSSTTQDWSLSDPVFLLLLLLLRAARNIVLLRNRQRNDRCCRRTYSCKVYICAETNNKPNGVYYEHSN